MATTNVTQAQPGDRFIDCASFLSPAVVRAAMADGVKGFMKYTRYDNTARGKYWTRPEWETVLEFGGYVMSNWEIQADRATTSANPYLTGRSDGARNRDWLRSIGYPETVAAPVSVDQNALFGNIEQVKAFVKGHWETDGDHTINMAYLDTDGGRALEDLDPHIWIPGAFYWSPDLYPLRNNRVALIAAASANPQAVALQFPSTAEYGIRVDQNLVLKPFNVWCAPYTVTPPPQRPDVVDPPTPPTQEDVMVYFTHSGPYGEQPGGFYYWALMPDGTKRHASGLEVDSIVRVDRSTAPRITAAEIDSIPDYVAATGGGATFPITVSGTFTGTAK